MTCRSRLQFFCFRGLWFVSRSTELTPKSHHEENKLLVFIGLTQLHPERRRRIFANSAYSRQSETPYARRNGNCTGSAKPLNIIYFLKSATQVKKPEGFKLILALGTYFLHFYALLSLAIFSKYQVHENSFYT